MATRKSQTKAQTLGHPLRGDIFLVNFDPSLGSEIQKTRPALVLQNDIANRFSPITIVAAITSRLNDRPYPTEVILETASTGLSLRSAALLNQLRSVDRQRLVRRLGRADVDAMKRVDRALQISLGLAGV